LTRTFQRSYLRPKRGVHAQIRNVATPIADRYPRATSIGALPDSELLARTLPPFELMICASRSVQLEESANLVGMSMDPFLQAFRNTIESSQARDRDRSDRQSLSRPVAVAAAALNAGAARAVSGSAHVPP
jgi:hypothetical protein